MKHFIKTMFTSAFSFERLGVKISAAAIMIGSTSIAHAQYCGPLNFTSGVEPITNVTFAGINNTTSATPNGTPVHEFFLNQTAVVTQGETFPISLNGNTDGSYTDYFVVFIDWNQNNVLDDAGEVYFGDGSVFVANNNGSGTPATGNIAVPAGAALGQTRMRIKKMYSDLPININPCVAGATWGQAEDYTVFVDSYCRPLNFPTVEPITNVTFAGINNTTSATLNGTPAHEYFLNQTAHVAPGQNYLISLNGNTAGNYKDYFVVFIDWNQNNVLDDAGEVYFGDGSVFITNNNGSGTPATEIIAVPADAALGQTRMRVKKMYNSFNNDPCVPGSFYGQAEDYTVFVDAYCGPLDFISGVEPITNVTFAGINNTTSPTVNGTPAHEYFLDQTANVTQGQTFPISLNGNTDGDYKDYFMVFIDWNQDGVLNDTGEVYFDDGSVFVEFADGVSNTPATGNITVPADAAIGQTRMRIKKMFSSSSTSTDPCAGTFFGQAEDYTVNVGAMAVSDVHKTAISVYPNPFTDVLKLSDTKGVKSITVFDVSGRAVKTLPATPELNLSDLKIGVYILAIQTDHGTESVKVIKRQ
ncbi:MAG: T9SS type A sorting domain-containing protein [Flavobacteriaceae bacterium]|jgi:hypothetical protein|nr:T9SS type A sorting domain-containing protein [Flavobacteriaceae bacterium]